MDEKLIDAIKKIHKPDEWVHFSSIGPDGGPHVTPLMMGMHCLLYTSDAADE